MNCAVCGKTIVRARLCLKHVQEYGTESDKYPPWLKYLIAQDQQDKRNEEKNFSLEYCDEMMDWFPEMRLRGVFKEIYDKQGRPCEEEALNNIEEDEWNTQKE